MVEMSEVREAERTIRSAIRGASGECWVELLNRAGGEEVWAVTRYAGPQRSAAVPHHTPPGG